MKSTPKEIYITSENEGTEDAFFQVHLKPDDAAAFGEKAVVTRYVKKETLIVEAIAKITVK